MTRLDAPQADQDEFDSDVLRFLEQHCEAVQRGASLTIPDALIQKCPELPEMVNCVDLLASFGNISSAEQDSVSPQDETLISSSGSFSSSLFQQLPRDFGSYCLESELGRGGMGVVYKARHRTLESHFALKMIRTSEFASDEEVRRFFQEARAASKLRHPNIVGVHDAGECEGLPFLVMTYIDGATLASRLKSGRLEINQALDLIIQVARAVQYLHEQGIVHRDLKPSNILIDGETAYVTDFGLAKVFEGEVDRTMSGTILGTPAYMAPEQAWGKPHETTAHSDLYSLGAILYELLTSRPPFDEDSPLEQLLRLRDAEPKPPSRIEGSVPRDLETVCLRCLEKKPENRYESAAALADDLERYRNGEPVSQPSLDGWSTVRRWARREPALAVHVIAVSAIIVIVQLAESLTPEFRQAHIPVMTTLGVWMGISVLFQKMLNRGIPFMRRTWIATDVVLFTVAVALPDSPFESLLPGYALLIIASSLWYKPRLVAVTTIACILSYCFLLKLEGSPDTPEHYPFLVVVILLVTGGIVISLVRRIRQLLMIRNRL